MNSFLKYLTCFLSVFILSCSQQEYETPPDVSHDEPEPGNKDQYCLCLEAGDEDCLEENVATGLIYSSACFDSEMYNRVADQLCGCLNSIGQASLKCDILQRQIDSVYTAAEQEIIAHYFKENSCE